MPRPRYNAVKDDNPGVDVKAFLDYYMKTVPKDGPTPRHGRPLSKRNCQLRNT
eukprot:gene8015-1431_t